MKNKILCLLLVLVMALGMLASCMGGGGDDTDDTTGGTTGGQTGGQTGGIESPYDWNKTSLFFQMNMNSHKQQLTSGSKKYLAGQDENAADNIDFAVIDRNNKAMAYSNVVIDYQYWPEGDSKYGWGYSFDAIQTFVSSNSTDQPDMYNTFMYDMMCASLQKSFANLRSQSRGANYFRFLESDYQAKVNAAKKNNTAYDDEGYMYDFMESLTLSVTKMYLLGSDYFFDTVRSFFIVPVNVNLFNSIKQPQNPTDLDLKYTSDRTGDGVFDVNDFIQLIWDREWTYEAIAYYSKAVFKESTDASNKIGASVGDTLGFAVEAGTGFSASGVIYTSSVTVINKTEEFNDKGELVWTYAYPAADSEQANALFEVADGVTSLFQSTGVLACSENVAANGNSFSAQLGVQTELVGIRQEFAANRILFGGFIMTGNLEDPAYQNMKNGDGFAIAPGPLYKAIQSTEYHSDTPEAEREGKTYRDYQTQMHNLARLGAISEKTTKFSQCTAFLNYQSTNSTEILDTYYDQKLTLLVAGRQNGNAKVMAFIRSHVRSAFDKAYEDAIGFFYETGDENAGAKKWHSMIKGSSDFQPGDSIKQNYTDLANEKQGRITSLEQVYQSLPD